MAESRPLTEVEREIALADIAYLKQREIDSGDRDKWEATQPGWRLERILREERERREALARTAFEEAAIHGVAYVRDGKLLKREDVERR